MTIVTKNESGMVAIEMTASSGLIHSIIASVPTTVRIEVMS